MDHRIPKVGVAISVVLAIGALITFLFLNNKFEGPDPTGFVRSPKQLTASFPNTKKLPTKQPVLFKGISVGRVNKVDWDPERKVGIVTFTIDGDFEIYEDAVLKIGEKSLLGDPFLDVIDRGSERERELEEGDVVGETRTSVNFDEALDFLDREGRRRVKSLIETVADGASRPGNGERLNGSIGGVARTVTEAQELTRALRGQEEQIARLVSSASTVLSEIGRREQAVRTIVGSGRTTLDALASNTASLERGVAELPRLLGAGRRSLAEARPLLAEARAPAAKLRALAPDLTKAFESGAPFSLAQVNRDLVAIIEGLPPLRQLAEPVLTNALVLMEKLQPLVKVIAPAARNLVPGLDYLTAGKPGTSRAEAIAGLYALIGATAQGRDEERGHYLRAGFTLDPAEFLDQPQQANCDPASQGQAPNQGFCNNAYPDPGDALDPQPFAAPYPRLRPCDPPSRDNPRAPCK